MSSFSHWLANRFAGRQTSKSRCGVSGPIRKKSRVALERLESRDLLALTATFAAGQLTFTDTTGSGNNTLILQMSGSTVTYIADGGPATVQPGVTSVIYNETLSAPSGTAPNTGGNVLDVLDQAGGATITINGSNAFYNTTPIALVNPGSFSSLQAYDNSNAGGDTINVLSTSINSPVAGSGTIVGYLHGAGNDTFAVSSAIGSLNGITAPLTVSAGGVGAMNTLLVSDTAGTTAKNVTLTSSIISGFAGPTGGTVIHYSEALGGFLDVDLQGSNNAGTAFTVTSTLGAGNTVTLQGGLDGGNTYNIGAMPFNPATPLLNNGNLDLIKSAVTVSDASGTGTLAVNDHGSMGAFNYDVTPTSVTNDASSPLRTFAGVTYSGIGVLIVDGNNQNNTFFVTPSTATTYYVNGWGSTGGTGNVLNMNLAGTTGAHVTHEAEPPNPGGTPIATGSGVWSFTDAHMDVFFTNMQTVKIAPVTIPILAVAADAGATSAPMVQVYDATTGQLISNFLAYEPTYQGGVHVAVGTFDNTGGEEIAVSPGRAHSPLVEIFDPFGDLLYSFLAYGAGYNKMGFSIAAGNVEHLTNPSTMTELDDIVVGQSYGGSDVRVFSNKSLTNPSDPFPTPPSGVLTPLREFSAFPASFLGGVTVAVTGITSITASVIGVSTTEPAGSVFGTGATIPITVTFNQVVFVTGTPTLTLNDGGVATLVSGSGTNTLIFDYKVTTGQNTPDLDYSTTGSLSLNGGTINTAGGFPAIITLPATGADGLAQKGIVIENITAGAWTVLANAIPFNNGDLGQMGLLLPNGDVMVHGGDGNASAVWYLLTPSLTNGFANAYIDGTWTQLASMALPRLFFGSVVLPSGEVFVLGGEYTDNTGNQTESNAGEIYHPATNTWTAAAPFPEPMFGDGMMETLPNGTVLVGSTSDSNTYIYNPTTNTWTQTGSMLPNENASEENWVKLPDGSILSYDVNSATNTGDTGTGTAERYIPSTGKWVSAGIVPAVLSYIDNVNPNDFDAFELGPPELLPDGRVFFLGATGNTDFYNPATNTWIAGPVIPDGLVCADAPSAMLPNGDVLFAASSATNQQGPPTHIFEFDPTTGVYADVTPANITNDTNGAFVDTMLVLPTGQVALFNDDSPLEVYTPAGNPQPAWRPTITGIANNGTSFTLTGTQLTGLSEGAAYGDDAQMASNYPIIELTNAAGAISFAQAFNWSSTGVATGATPETVQFTLPAGDAAGTYGVTVITNGIASATVQVNLTPAGPIGAALIAAKPAVGPAVTHASTPAVAVAAAKPLATTTTMAPTKDAFIVVGSGAGMVSTIDVFDITLNKVYNATTRAPTYVPIAKYFPFGAAYRGGVTVATVNAAPGNTTAEIIASQQNSGASTVELLNASTGAVLNTFQAYSDPSNNAPVRTVGKIINGRLEIFVGQGSDGRDAAILEYTPSTGAIVDFLMETDPSYTFGAFFLG